MRHVLPASLSLLVLLLASPSGPCAPTSRAADPLLVPEPAAPLEDCNGNGIEDAVDIALGGSSDVNLDGVPDECQAGAPAAAIGR